MARTRGRRTCETLASDPGQADQTGSAGGCQKTWARPTDRFAGQPERRQPNRRSGRTQAPDPTPVPSQDQGSRAGSTTHTLPAGPEALPTLSLPNRRGPQRARGCAGWHTELPARCVFSLSKGHIRVATSGLASGGLRGHRRVAGAGGRHPRRLNMFRSCFPGRGSAGQHRARAHGAGVEGDVCHATAAAEIGQIRPGRRA